MNQQTLEKMKDLKLSGMYRAFETVLENKEYQALQMMK